MNGGARRAAATARLLNARERLHGQRAPRRPSPRLRGLARAGVPAQVAATIRSAMRAGRSPARRAGVARSRRPERDGPPGGATPTAEVTRARDLEQDRADARFQSAGPAGGPRRARRRLAVRLRDRRGRAFDHETHAARRPPRDLARRRRYGAARHLRAVDSAGRLLPRAAVRPGGFFADARLDDRHRAAQRAAEPDLRVRPADRRCGHPATGRLAAGDDPARRRAADPARLQLRGTARLGRRARQLPPGVDLADARRRGLLVDLPAVPAGGARHPPTAGAAAAGTVDDGSRPPAGSSPGSCSRSSATCWRRSAWTS